MGRAWKLWARILLLSLVVGGLLPLSSQAETLSWGAVTTYTDGSSLGSASVTYTPVWSMSSSLTSPVVLGTGSISTTSQAFNVSTAAMPRGSTIYLGVRATVGGVNSLYSSPLSWLVPTLAPAAPTNLRVQ